MTMARSAGEVLREHVTLELECLDRLYLNGYVPMLQAPGGVAYLLRNVRGMPVPFSALMAPMTRACVAALERFAGAEGIDLITFGRGERSPDPVADREGDVLWCPWRANRPEKNSAERVVSGRYLLTGHGTPVNSHHALGELLWVSFFVLSG